MTMGALAALHIIITFASLNVEEIKVVLQLPPLPQQQRQHAKLHQATLMKQLWTNTTSQ